MTSPAIQPITEIVGQPQEYGRIRLGWKPPGKNYPEALKHFRLTSADRQVLDQAAEAYGGEVKPWDDPKARIRNQFELLTNSSELKVWIPNNDSFTVGYELWSGAGLARRCDGVSCFDTSADTDVDCLCAAHNLMECKPKTRVSFVLPDFNFGGVWRMDSGSWDVLKEMSGMLQMLSALAANQMFVQARLVLVEKSKMKMNVKKNKMEKVRWVIPQLIPETSAAALSSGEVPSTPVQLNGPAQAALEAAPEAQDAEIIDVEIVGEDSMGDIVNVIYPTKGEAVKAGHSSDSVVRNPNGKGWVVQ